MRASDRSRFICPISSEASTMPRDKGRRLDERERVRPSPPEAGDNHPESSVDRAKAWVRRCVSAMDR